MRVLSLNFELMYNLKLNFIFLGPRMVMAGAGGVNHQELCDLTSKHFGKIGHTYDNEIPIDLNCRYTGIVQVSM